MDNSIFNTTQKWADDIAQDIKAFLEQSGIRATGKLIDSIRIEVNETDNGVEMTLFLEDYGRFVLEGRAPGKQPPLSKIKEWTRIRGISEDAAFPIARKIGKEGIKPFNFLAPFYQQLPQLSKTIERDYAGEIEEGLVRLLKNIKSK